MLFLVLNFTRLLTFFHSFKPQLAAYAATPANPCRYYGKTLLWHGLAANTRQVYRVCQATFAKFAVTNGFVPAFPVQFKAQFIATTAEETSSDTYVAHLRSYHIDLGYPTAIFP